MKPALWEPEHFARNKEFATHAKDGTVILIWQSWPGSGNFGERPIFHISAIAFNLMLAERRKAVDYCFATVIRQGGAAEPSN